MNTTQHELIESTSAKLASSILFERETSSRTAVVCAQSGVSLSYAELARMSKTLAADLRRNGLRPRERVAIFLTTSVELAAALFGAWAADAVVVPLDIFMKRAELLAILAAIQPRFLITNPNLHRKIHAELHQTAVCILEFGPSLMTSFVAPAAASASGLRVSDHGAPLQPTPHPRPAPDEDAVMILSSGTTGLPKAVRLSHQAVLRNISMHLESLGIEEDIRGLQVLPMNYSYGLIASFLSILHTGGTAVLQPALEARAVLDAVRDHDVNVVMGTPAIFQHLVESVTDRSALHPSPVRYVTIGGDRCKRYALDLIRKQLPKTKTYITYGLSEAGPRVSTLPPEQVEARPQSVGLPLRGVEVRILDDRGKKCHPQEKGEIIVKTPSLMNGYFGDPERTQRTIRDGFCHTGDIGYLDDAGFLYYLGRKDRQFKLGGHLVNPAFVEHCISSHPLVREAVVEKIENERDESLCAKITTVPAPQQELVTELKRLCRQQMPEHMIPREFRFENSDRHYYKGKPFNAAKSPVPDEPVCETRG